jgi:hypothetical protein
MTGLSAEAMPPATSYACPGKTRPGSSTANSSALSRHTRPDGGTQLLRIRSNCEGTGCTTSIMTMAVCRRPDRARVAARRKRHFRMSMVPLTTPPIPTCAPSGAAEPT